MNTICQKYHLLIQFHWIAVFGEEGRITRLRKIQAQIILSEHQQKNAPAFRILIPLKRTSRHFCCSPWTEQPPEQLVYFSMPCTLLIIKTAHGNPVSRRESR